MSAVDSTLQLTTLLESWDAEFSSATSELATLLSKTIDYQGAELNLVELLRRLAEIVEHETEEWYKSDPDPFDDRHPGRADPNCALGHVMKILFKNDTFMSKLVNSYLTGRDHTFDELHIIASRLLLDIMPGLETSVIFQDNESLIKNLIEWSQTSSEPLCSYATGLLACAMEIQEVASAFKDSNSILVPLMLRRLQSLKEENHRENLNNYKINKRHFKDVGKEGEHKKSKHSTFSNSFSSKSSKISSTCDTPSSIPSSSSNSTGKPRNKRKKGLNGVSDDDDVAGTPEVVSRRHSKRMRTSSPNNISGFFSMDEDQMMSVVVEDKKLKAANSTFDEMGNSNSCWAEVEPLVICKFCMWPLSIEMRQRLILTYLQPMGEYQELLLHVFELPVLDLLFYYIDLKQNKDVRLAFEALKYMAALLCHKKFAVEFISAGGIQKLLAVERPSVAATGVSMCLYYLAYFDDPMERVCLLPQSTLVDMVSFALWLLKCKHESGRVHATMFFGLSFLYKIIVDIFDQKGGLRMLFNVVSTQRILNVADALSELTDDELFTNRQSSRHVTVAIRRYLEAHLTVKSDEIRKSNMRNEEEIPMIEAPTNKATKFFPDMIQDNVELLLEYLPAKTEWKPVCDLIKLGGVQTLMHLLYISEEWTNYSGKVETLRSVLDILSICCVVHRTSNLLCESIKLPDNINAPAVSILLSLASGQNLPEPEVQKAALNVIINSVCGPITKLSGKMINGPIRRRNSIATNEEPLSKMWAAIRNNNGIMVLLNLLNIKLPVTEADSIRALACKALVGLSRCCTVKQIISKLPMYSNGQLQQLMWEPVLQDKRSEHVKFCRYAMLLIEQVSGKPSQGTEDPSLDRMRRADIVAQTNIVFNNKELLQLIHEHLLKEGLQETASILAKEASLQLPPASSALVDLPQVSINQTPRICKSNGETSFVMPPTPLSTTPKPPTAAFAAPANHVDITTPGRKIDILNAPNPASFVIQPKMDSSLMPNINNSSAICTTAQSSFIPSSTRLTNERKEFATPLTPVGNGRLPLRRGHHTPASTNQQRLKQLQNTKYEYHSPGMCSIGSTTPAANQLSILSDLPNQKGSISFGTSSQNNILTNRINMQHPTLALSTIVTSYLQHQHANCRNPVATCPPFSLLKPHRCPEPKNRRNAPASITSRHFTKQLFPAYGGFDGVKNDRKYIFSKFRPFRSYRDSDGGIFSCCAFTADQRSLLLGTCTGDLKMYNIATSEETFLNQCHEAPITHCEPSRDGSLVLTSSTWGSSMCALWKMTGSFDIMYTFNEDEHVEFSKQTQDKIVGTKEGIANIYDVNTGTKLYSLFDREKNNNYSRNKATFGPTDELVLNDGVLWDLDSHRPIHKFDKFNPNISGVFHPNGMEVIINSQVWDVRTYHLLYTVEALDQCQIRFNKTGKILYGAIYQMDEDDLLDDSRTRNSFNSSFRTFDGTDYSSIATVDVKRAIYDLCPDVNDTHLAIVENYRQSDTMSEESVCRLYEIGRLKDSEDEQIDDDEDNPDENDEDDDDDDDTVTVAFDNDRNVRLSDEPDDLLNDLTSGSESDFDIDLDLIDDDDDDDGDEDEDDMDADEEEDDDDDDDDNSGVASRLRSRNRRSGDEDDDDDDDLDNMLFELSDMSNF